MVSPLLYYQLALIALVWLCLMLHGAWPSDPATCPPPSAPTPPKPKRHRKPTPFAGLPTKPPCDACAHASTPLAETPSTPPPRIVPTRGRRRRYFLETLGTLFQGKRASVDLIVRVIACLAERLGIRGTARVFEVDPNTVRHWLVEAADQLRAFSRHLLHDMRVRQVQLDALFALLRAVKEGKVSEAEARERLERSPQWVWVAMDSESKLLLALNVGERTLAMAQHMVHQVAQVLASDCAPLFLTDGLREDMTALLTHYGHWIQAPRRQATGSSPKPRWRPRPQLLDAQVVKTVRRRRLGRVSHRVVFGTLEAIQEVLAKHAWQITTSFVERLHLDVRQHVAAIGRRGNTLCKQEAGLRQQ